MKGHETAQDAENRGSLNAETGYLHHLLKYSENIVGEGKKEYKNLKISIGHTEHHLLNEHETVIPIRNSLQLLLPAQVDLSRANYG